MPVQEEVLLTACRIASGRKDWSFDIAEVVRALPHLNEATVRTHIGSRCCVNAPANHLHRWDYFRRLSRAHYQVEPPYRRKPAAQTSRSKASSAPLGGAGRASGPPPSRRDTIHAVIQRDASTYVGECLEIAVVTQGRSLDEVVENLREAIALHLEDEDMASLGLAPHPRIQFVYDMAVAL